MIVSTVVGGVGRCSRCGREERSLRPSGPSARKRFTHLLTVLQQTPKAWATRFEFPGDRVWVRDRTVKSALQILRLHLLNETAPLLWEHSA